MKLSEVGPGVITPFTVMLKKDLKLAYKNPMLFGLLVATPFLLIAVLSEAFSPLFEGRSSFEVPVVDLEQSADSARLAAGIDGLETIQLKLVEWNGAEFTPADAARLIADDRRYFAVLVIGGSPDGSAERQVVLYSDPSQTGFSGILKDQISSHLELGALAGFTENPVEPTAEVRVETASEGQAIPSRFEQTVPGFSVMFTFWLASLLAASVYIERKEYRTWRRTLASPAAGWTIVGSRITAYVILGLSQMLVMFLLGGIFFGIDLGWNIGPLILIFVALALVTTSFGFLMISLTSDMALLSMVMNLLVIGMALLGGALIPTDYIPEWAQRVSFLTPHYWAIDGIQEVIILGAGVTSIARQVGMLLLFSVLFFFLGSLRFRIAD